MKKIILLFLCLSTVVSGRAQVVSNVNWQLDDRNEKIIITYDLSKQQYYTYFDISVNVRVGANAITPSALEGDVGSFIKIGTGKRIVWNVFEDVSELNGELTVEVLAQNPVPNNSQENKEGPPPEPTANYSNSNSIPAWAGLGVLGTAGLGLMLKGVSNTSDANELYTVYQDHLNPEDPIYSELNLSREETYDEANKKNKTGTYLIIGGAAVLVTAGIIMINRMIQTKKLRNKQLSFEPVIQIDPAGLYARGNGNQYGLKFSYTFK